MASPIQYLAVIRYYKDGRPWTEERIKAPSWSVIEDAIRRMDNYCYPIVQLGCSEYEDDEDSFNVIGGNGRFALFHMMGDWQYKDPLGSTAEVRLWDSDQGYFCQERNVLTDVDKVLRIVKAYFESGSYDQLDEVE